jgi:hypothetical protein
MASTITVTNSGSGSLTVYGQTIAANGGSYTFSAGQISNVASDVNFRASFLNGNCTFSINGQSFSYLEANIEDFLDQLAAGEINV